MPQPIEPIGNPVGPPADYKPPSADWGWLSSQPFNHEVSDNLAGSNYRPGSIMGPPSQDQFDYLINPRKYATYAPAPAITAPAQTQQKAFGRFGTVTLDMIDPFLTAQSVQQGAGVSQIGASQGTQGIASFLAQKDLDPFGQGSSGIPVRLFDYATGWLGAITDQARGKPIQVPVPTGADAMQYAFQRDPSYWAFIDNANDAGMQQLANAVAGRYVSGDNTYLAQKLLAQFKIDRDRALGLSSGDVRTDYLAKLAFTQDYVNQRTGGGQFVPDTINKPTTQNLIESAYRGGSPAIRGYSTTSPEAQVVGLAQLPAAVVTALPFVGTDLAQSLYQNPKSINDAWTQLTPDQRQHYFGTAGVLGLVGDLTVWTPMLSGLGAVEAIAARGTGALHLAFKAYEYGRNVTAAVMATGLTVATANWAAEAAVPGYADTLGKRIDYARPFSSSSLAGLINQAGFFSSGTFGATLAARALPRIPGAIAGGLARAADLADVTLPKVSLPAVAGAKELAYFSRVFGGSPIQAEIAGTGLPNAGLLELAPKRAFTSNLQNWVADTRRAIVESAMRGQATFTSLDRITDPEAKLAVANEWLLRGAEDAPAQAEALVRVMLEARRPRPLLAGESQRAHDAAVRMATFLDNEMTDHYLKDFGPGWLSQRAGAYTTADLERYAKAAVDRLGGDSTKLAAHNDEGWGQVIRYLHNYEYDLRNGMLQEVGVDSTELDKLLLVRSDHNFANDVDPTLAILRGEDAAAAARKTAADLSTKREAGRWFANEWTPPAGVTKRIENVTPGEYAAWLEDVRDALPTRRSLPPTGAPSADLPLNAFHAQLEKDGLWTLAFKPTDAEGNAISYVHTRSGRAFQSPWIEYPMGNHTSIDLGNRNLLLHKLDGMTRGFRTRRILEMQKGALYRRLTSQYAFTPDQIEAFHAGVLELARKLEMQPETVGAIGRSAGPLAGAALVKESIDALAKRTFGSGPYLLRSGGEVGTVDWAKEIAKSYTTAYRLNLTAGLTSHMKANLGELGGQIAWLSDPGYVNWRFNLSPLFKGGELWETKQLNAMRGVRGIGPTEQALYYRAGVGNDYGAFAEELPLEPMTQALGTPDASGRFAASMAFYSRGLPESFELRGQTAQAQGAAEDFRSFAQGGQLPSAGWLPIRQSDRVVPPDAIPEGFSPYLADHAPEYVTPDLQPEDQILLHATTSMSGVYRDGLLPGRKVENVGLGSGGTGNHQVSVTWDYGLADTIIGRLRMASLAAQGKASADDILNHFSANYGDDIAAMAAALEAPARVTTDNALTRWMNTKANATPEARFAQVQALDNGLAATAMEPDAYRGFVGLTGTWEDAAKINADDLGIVKVAARKGAAAVKHGPDYAELRFDHGDLAVIDDRSLLPPLAEDEAGLLEQLRATLAEHPKDGQLSIFDQQIGGNGVASGLEDRARRIVTKLEDLYRQKVDGGPVIAWADAGVERQAAFEQRLRGDGWLPIGEQIQKLYDEGGQDAVNAAQDLNRVAGGRRGGTAESGGAMLPSLPKVPGPEDVATMEASANFKAYGKGRPTAIDRINEQGYVTYVFRDTEGYPAGELRIRTDPEQFDVVVIDVRANARRMGVASSLYDRAIRDGFDVIGGPRRSFLTDQGKAFRRAYAESRGYYANDLWARRRLDGSAEAQPIGDLFAHQQRSPGTAESMQDVAGTGEALFEDLLPRYAEEQARAGRPGWRQFWETFKNPTPWKLGEASKLQIKFMRDDFPALLHMSGNDGLAKVLAAVEPRKDRWLDWLVSDSDLRQRWVDSADPADLERLVAHYGGKEHLDESMQAFLKSEDWTVLQTLIHANLTANSERASGIHFFSSYRSPIERSLNHPLLGVYPASWTIKVAREWAKFLYDNQTLGLSIGMTPAQALARVVNAQQAALAESGGTPADDYLSTQGPLGSAALIFNLLLPGDWSGLPFSMSRTIKSYTRPFLADGSVPKFEDVLLDNFKYIGATRDVRLFGETFGELWTLMNHPGPKDSATVLRNYSVRGATGAQSYDDASAYR